MALASFAGGRYVTVESCRFREISALTFFVGHGETVGTIWIGSSFHECSQIHL